MIVVCNYINVVLVLVWLFGYLGGFQSFAITNNAALCVSASSCF